MLRKSLFALCLIALMVPSLPVAAWEGKVIGVKDGQTIIVFDGKNPPVIVGLKGVRIAEQKNRDYNRDAREFISRMVFNKKVEIKDELKADGGGLIGEVVMPDGKSLNAELLRQDFARDSEQTNTPVAAAQKPRETYSPAPVVPTTPVSSAKPARTYSPPAAVQNTEPSPVAGVRKWRDKEGNMHFSGTVGRKD